MKLLFLFCYNLFNLFIMANTKIRARYAPSPTGFFHIGGARTALLNYLFAKRYKGYFIVRIEDTDTARNVEGGTESQLANLAWMDIVPEESPLNPGPYGPYVQTQKLKRYQDLAHKLLKEGKAYYCFCKEEDLEKDRQMALANHQTPKYSRRCLYLSPEEIQAKLDAKVPYVIRLKMKDNTNIEWDDLVRGKMSVPSTALTDPVLLKSNGIPMYNFAVVIDDYDMKMTHILRGEEHISHTPYQIAIQEALGFNDQDLKYGHLSVITDETGKKLSKRNKALKQFVEDFRVMGVLPNALDNFLALLGWSPKTNQEIYLTLNELVEAFDIERVSKAPACFDPKKLFWISGQHFKKMDDNKYLEFVKPFITIDLNQYTSKDNHDMLLLMFKPQISAAIELNTLIPNTFGNIDFDHMDQSLKDFINNESSQKVLKALKQKLEAIDTDKISVNIAEQIVNQLKQELLPIKGKEFFLPLRVACIAKEHGPEMPKTIALIGKAQLLKNLAKLIK